MSIWPERKRILLHQNFFICACSLAQRAGNAALLEKEFDVAEMKGIIVRKNYFYCR